MYKYGKAQCCIFFGQSGMLSRWGCRTGRSLRLTDKVSLHHKGL